MAEIEPSRGALDRSRRQHHGFVRVELEVKREEVALIRGVAHALVAAWLSVFAENDV